MTSRRAGIVLPVVLVVIGLLTLVMAGFLFFVRAELAGARAQRDSRQARLAAESGLQEVIMILRDARDDPSAWFDVPQRFRHALVWAESYDRLGDPVRKMGSRAEILAEPTPPVAWRYSVVAPNLDGPPNSIRYGITPEASKLNLNAASEAEIERLLVPLLLDLGLQEAPSLIAALLDWLDTDDQPRPDGAEDEYYTRLQPGYHAKNGPLSTLEELLLIKGWTAAAVYGEDVNRNGLLDPNEDDGEESFPYYDDGDGELDSGVAPFVTVWSREPGSPQGGQGAGQGQTQTRIGLINVNTAPLRVLQALDGMTAEAAESIVALRGQLDAEALREPDWVVSAGALDPSTYEQLKGRLTTRALQFHVEILGYADHTQLVGRYEWVIEMRGPVAQVLYHRDLTSLGRAWPIDDDAYLVRTE